MRLCAQVLIEFWAVATRPRENNGLDYSGHDAKRQLDKLLSWIPCLDEPPDIARRWFDLVVRYQCAGKTTHDARIAALAIAFDAQRIVTLNSSHFRRFDELQVVTPNQLLA